ncbi:MAG: DUF1015 domain-containing protein [Chloroflexota bacterium]
MAEIRPFRGVRYNPALAKPEAVICPPYDIINPRQKIELLEGSQYNFVRLEAAQAMPHDTDRDNKFTRTRTALDEWLERGVLKADAAPAFYLHDHYFSFGGKSYRRRGLIATVRLEEWDRMVVRPHEDTFAEPKKERLDLMWATSAGLSPIMALYQDPGKRLGALLEKAAGQKPELDFVAGGERHRLRVITQAPLLKQITGSLAAEPLYIADGHHRYESALAYCRGRRVQSPRAGPDAGFNFVLMTLIDFDDPGLLVLPPHRLVRGLSAATLKGLAARLEGFFKTEWWPLGEGVWPRVTRLLEEGEPSQDRLVVVGLEPERVLVLKLKDPAAARPLMPGFHSERYQHLLVSVVDKLILEKLLALGSSHEDPRLGYFYDREQVVRLVQRGEYQLAFLLSPVNTRVIKDVADGGFRMPRKATYFYPKLPSGLVFYRMG